MGPRNKIIAEPLHLQNIQKKILFSIRLNGCIWFKQKREYRMCNSLNIIYASTMAQSLIRCLLHYLRSWPLYVFFSSVFWFEYKTNAASFRNLDRITEAISNLILKLFKSEFQTFFPNISKLKYMKNTIRNGMEVEKLNAF